MSFAGSSSSRISLCFAYRHEKRVPSSPESFHRIEIE